MNSKVEQPKSASTGDMMMIALAVLIAAAGVFAFYWFQDAWPSWARTLSVVGGLLIGAGVFMLSAKGAQTREYLAESRFELRKVVWPTRQEAGRATGTLVESVGHVVSSWTGKTGSVL